MQTNLVNFVGFNQDHQCILLGNSCGYAIYGIDNDRVLEMESNKVNPILKVGRLFCSSLIIYVAKDDPRKLTLFHHKRDAIIIEVKFSNSILSLKLNRKVVVVCTEDGIYIYDTESMRRKHKVEMAPSNRNGVFALSTGDISMLAYPSSNIVGNVHVFNVTEMKNTVIIEAHQGAIAAMEFNQSSDSLATASDKGTVIRLFKIPNGDKIGEFRRGFARCAIISCLSFSLDSQFLLACSNTETVHVFNLSLSSDKDPCNRHSNPNHKDDIGYTSVSSESNTSKSTWSNYLCTAIKTTSSFLPYPAQQVSEMFSQDRCFCVARLPTMEQNHNATKSSQRKVGAVIKYDFGWRIVVATYDGSIYIFKFDSEHGGEAELLIIYDFINGKHLTRNVPLKSQDIKDEGPLICNSKNVCTNRSPNFLLEESFANQTIPNINDDNEYSAFRKMSI